MPKSDNFIDRFLEDHTELLELVSKFHNAVETLNQDKARGILRKIEYITEGHFSFEENYLYPRLRRLILEITGNLGKEQETMRDFLAKSKVLLGKDKLDRDKLSYILETLPRLSKLFSECNDLISLAKKFSKDDKDDLNQRFLECKEAKREVTV